MVIEGLRCEGWRLPDRSGWRYDGAVDGQRLGDPVGGCRAGSLGARLAEVKEEMSPRWGRVTGRWRGQAGIDRTG